MPKRDFVMIGAGTITPKWRMKTTLWILRVKQNVKKSFYGAKTFSETYKIMPLGHIYSQEVL